jgi:hypothetical protein
MNMQPVADQFRRDIFPLCGCTDHSGLPMMERGHGIEQMRHMDALGMRR